MRHSSRNTIGSIDCFSPSLMTKKKMKNLDETKEIVVGLLDGKFNRGASHRMLTVEFNEIGAVVSERKIYDALKVLLAEDKVATRGYKTSCGHAKIFFAKTAGVN